MRESRFLTAEDRRIIEKLHRKRMTQKQIAEILDVNQSTISRELKKGHYLHNMGYKDVNAYSWYRAQDITQKRYKNKGRELKLSALDYDSLYMIETLITAQFSPYAALVIVSNNIGYRPFCLTTLYNYIYSGKFPKITYFHLWEKLKRKKRREVRPKEHIRP